MDSKVNHPDHYNIGDIETIDYLESLGIAEDFCIGNAIKYLSRYKHKDDELEDLEKAQWYLTRAIKIVMARLEKPGSITSTNWLDEYTYITFHTCGFAGFNPLKGDVCEACKKDQKKGKYDWQYTISSVQVG